MSEDCTAVGFSGEGRCIEPAAVGPLCVDHAAACECDCHDNPTRGCWCACA